MKNLKLFVAPLLGAALLTACGPKAINVKDFRAKVEENFNLETVKKYIGKKQHVTGTSPLGPVDETYEIADVVPLAEGGSIYCFVYKDGSRSTDSPILSAALVDHMTPAESGGPTVNFFISGDTYTIEAKYSAEGANTSAKYVYNKDLVVTHFETKISSKDLTMNIDSNYKYE